MPSYQSDGRPQKKPRAGLEPNLKQRLMRGREEIDGTIDLHGMRQVEARAALGRFIHARWSRGDRTVLVITGKGLKKLDDDAAVIVERGVLRRLGCRRAGSWRRRRVLCPAAAREGLSMTPLGARLRALREERGVTLKQMAAALNVSSAYLSALEHGKRGKPTWMLLQRIIAYFNIIWDEAEELQRLAELSDPRVTIDTAGMAPEATELANRLARDIGRLDGEGLAALNAELVRRMK
jgi:transcriptional regulator with XRE-family HTH domain